MMIQKGEEFIDGVTDQDVLGHKTDWVAFLGHQIEGGY